MVFSGTMIPQVAQPAETDAISGLSDSFVDVVFVIAFGRP